VAATTSLLTNGSRSLIAAGAVINASIWHRGRRAAADVATVAIEVFAVVVFAGLVGNAVASVVAVLAFLTLFLTAYVMIMGRAYEIGVQRALGATRLDIVLAAEGEVLALWMAGSIGALGIAWLGQWFLHLAYPSAGIAFSSMWAAKAVTVVIGAAVLGSSFPLARLTLSSPVASLRKT
jgi:ABC-type antimicrobial peptide transport system permease subunit